MNVSSTLKTAKSAVTSKVGRQILLGQKHSPVILFTAGTVGTVASTVLACRATLKLEDTLAEHRENLEKAKEAREVAPEKYTEKDYRRDVTIVRARQAVSLGKLYGPALTVGALSVCALGGSHLILTKRNAGLMAAYAALEKGFNEYRERVVGEIGEDREKEIRYGFETREVVDNEGKTVNNIRTVNKDQAPSIYARLFQEGNPNWRSHPEYNIAFLRCQQNWANDRLRARGHVFLNEVYDLLGMDRTREGSVVGWVKGNGDNYIDFGVFDDERMDRFLDFVSGREGALLLDFNVDGTIWDKI